MEELSNELVRARAAAGRKRIVRGFRRERSDWEVLIKDHHEALSLRSLRSKASRCLQRHAQYRRPLSLPRQPDEPWR